MVKRVLFVDDEPSILSGLRRMLHSARDQLSADFAADGETALKQLDSSQFDAVVTDMRMPQLSGVELLDIVRDRHPSVVRIILSGQSERDCALQSVGLAHQFLAKPCEAETIQETIARACALRDRLSDDRLRSIATAVRTLPSLPTTYSDILRAVESPDAATSAVGDIISRDVAMTAMILHVINSAFFGLPRRIGSPSQAVTLLGLDTVQALVLSSGVFSQFDAARFKGFTIESLSAHSLLVGSCAKKVAAVLGAEKRTVDDSFMAGVLHDVGVLVLLDSMPELLFDAMCHADDSAERPEDRERRILGATHAEVGGYLMGIWGLSETIVDACIFHTSPSNSSDDRFTPLTAVHIADCLAAGAHQVAFESASLDSDYLERVGVAARLGDVEAACSDLLERVAV